MEKTIKDILEGKIFIYPTDTVYGIGCNAMDEKAVEKIKQIKQRERNKPLSIMVPGIKWIKENCIIDVDINKYLPGPYTLILRKKNPDFMNHVSPTEFLGIRIPACSFSEKVKKAKTPFISTSVNLAGEPPAKSIKDIPEQILKKADRVIDQGELKGQPSILIKNSKEIKR